MSSSPSELQLGALQCHFTWDLSSSRYKLQQLRDKLLDICPDETNPWRGHIDNLLGFVQTRLGRPDEALSLFSLASEALQGPALLVNYSDLAWLHHERGEAALSQEFLQRVEDLSREHVTERDQPEDPTEELLHPEVLAEKAWTLMKMGPAQKQAAAELFERALKEQPQRVEWRSSQAIALMSAHKHDRYADRQLLRQVQRAHAEDPENMYLSAEYFNLRAKNGEKVKDEVDELVDQIIKNANSSYSGLKPVLRFYRFYDEVDTAIFWVDEALDKHPDSGYVKRCAALCYKWRVLFQQDGASKRQLLEKGVRLLKEVISLYPDTALVKEIDLADMYGKSEPAKAEEMYQTLLQRSLEPSATQMLYNRYAKHIQYDLKDIPRCIEYHIKAALINHDSFFRNNSRKLIGNLKKQRWESVLAEHQRSTLNTRLGELQCHFTWELERSRALMFSVRDTLEDLLPDETNPWRGHIYNLLGFLQTRLGRPDEALSLFSSASEALKGPALLVNYSNLAWLHHERGEAALSQEFLQRVEDLSREHVTERDQPHPEVFAEKAWTQMELYRNHRLAVRLFQKALQMEERVEWRSCLTLASFYAQSGKNEDLLEQMKQASERDPDNLQLRAEYLGQCARSGQEVGPEAAALADQVLLQLDGVHKDIRPLLELYRSIVSVDAAVDLAAKALDKRPDSRSLKACLALCYTFKVQEQEAPSQELIDQAAALLREVISLYPDSSFRKDLDLANIYSKSNHNLADATRIYNQLLDCNLESPYRQELYNSYAKFLFFDMDDSYRSTQFHLRAAKIPVTSSCRANSIQALQRIVDRRECDPRLRAEVEDFLRTTPEV